MRTFLQWWKRVCVAVNRRRTHTTQNVQFPERINICQRFQRHNKNLVPTSGRRTNWIHGAWIHSWYQLDGSPNCHLGRTWRVSPPIPPNPNSKTNSTTSPIGVQPLWRMTSMMPVVIRLGENPALLPSRFRKQPADCLERLVQKIGFLNRIQCLYCYSTQTRLVTKPAESQYVKAGRVTLVK